MADKTQLYTRQPDGHLSYFSAAPGGKFYAGDTSAAALDQLANGGFHEVDPETFARHRLGYEQDLPGTPATSPFIPRGNAAAHPVSTLPPGASRVATRSIDGSTPYFHANAGYMEEGRLPEGEDPQQLAEQGYVFADAPAFTEARTRLDPMRPPQDHSTPDAPPTSAEDAALSALAGEMDRPYPKGEDAPQDVDALAAAFDADMAPRAQPRATPRSAPRRPIYDVQNVPASVAMASPLGGTPLPSPRGGLARAVDARDENGAPDSVETLADVQDRASHERSRAMLMRGGARMGAALAGIRPDSGAADDLEKGADRQVSEYLQRKQSAEVEKQQAEADALKSPDSPQSKRFQEVVGRTLPGIYTDEQIAHMTAADKDTIFDAGKMRATLDARAQEQADARAAQEVETTARATEAGKQRAFQASEAGKNRALDRELAGMKAGAATEKAGAPAKGSVIPGYEIAEGAAPTAVDATKVKTALASSKKMTGYLNALDALHAKYGTEYGGAAGTNMGQLVKSIQLEAKTIAELGALSGPDQQLMEDLAGADPSSFWSNVKAMAGSDNTDAAIKGLRKWMDTSTGALLDTYGYRPQGGATAQQAPTAGGPLPAGKIRIRLPSGETRIIPEANRAEAMRDYNAQVVL